MVICEELVMLRKSFKVNCILELVMVYFVLTEMMRESMNIKSWSTAKVKYGA